MKEESSQAKKNFSHMKCFKCHQKEHYASQYPKKKKGKLEQ
jgi:hypothetical protein